MGEAAETMANKAVKPSGIGRILKSKVLGRRRVTLAAVQPRGFRFLVMNDDFRPNSQSYREWLDSRSEPPELKIIAVRAIDAFESITHNRRTVEEPLNDLYSAASHPRFVVWEVGLTLLAQLAEHSKDARAKILDLAHDRKAENRRRSHPIPV